MAELRAHPGTGRTFASPVPAGSEWPGEPASIGTPVATSPSEVSELAVATPSLIALDAAVSVCRACPRLVSWREQVAREKRPAYATEPYWGRPAPGWGDPDASALIVGLAPAAHGANRTGRIFTGDRSGDWLYAALHRAGFANQSKSVHAADGLMLTGVRITAPVHCAPPGNQPTTSEKQACAPWLDREFALLEPRLKAVLALGGIAWQETLRAVRRRGWTVPRPAPKFGHGAEVELTTAQGRAVRLVGCFHVSQQNTFTGRLTLPMLDAAIARLR